MAMGLCKNTATVSNKYFVYIQLSDRVGHGVEYEVRVCFLICFCMMFTTRAFDEHIGLYRPINA